LSVANQCPVCQARFRGAAICSRCGADLGRLMHLAAQAWWLREAARAAITAREFGRVVELAAKAQEVQSTPAGEALLRLGYWLQAEAHAPNDRQ
jgi:predicted amidophosphoribosyltransferase